MDQQETYIPPQFPTAQYPDSQYEAGPVAIEEMMRQQAQQAQQGQYPAPDMREFFGMDPQGGDADNGGRGLDPQVAEQAIEGQFRRGLNIGVVAGFVVGCLSMYLVLGQGFAPTRETGKGGDSERDS
jgi:hypothetical protein